MMFMNFHNKLFNDTANVRDDGHSSTGTLKHPATRNMTIAATKKRFGEHGAMVNDEIKNEDEINAEEEELKEWLRKRTMMNKGSVK